MSVHVTNSATVVSETGSLDLPRIGFENLARDATISASSADDDFPADAAARPDTYEYWQPTALSAWWKADLGSVQTVNYVGIASHDLGSLSLGVTAQYSTDGLLWSDASDQAAPSDDSAILLLFPEQTARYWRILVDAVGSPSGDDMPSIGVIYLGSILAMPRPIYGGHAPITLSRETTLYQGLSRGGQFLGQSIRRSGFASKVSFRHLTASFVRSSLDPFIRAARKFPYFFAWRAGDWDDEVAYVWTPSDIRPANMGIRDFMEVGWELRGFDP